MLRELRNVSQNRGDRFRRSFADENLELVIWYEPGESIYGFQLSYDPQGTPRILTWTIARGFNHALIDGGEDSPSENRSPLLRPSDDYNAARLRDSFLSAMSELPEPERTFVAEKLAEFGAVV